MLKYINSNIQKYTKINLLIYVQYIKLGVFLNIVYNFIFQMIYSEVKENIPCFTNKQQQRNLNNHPHLTNSRCSSDGFLNSLDITQSRMTDLNFDHVIQPKSSKQKTKVVKCLSCQHWEHWAVESEHTMLLIEKKLIQREKALQEKMKLLKNRVEEQDKIILAKQRQYERLKIKDQQIILQLNQKLQELQNQSKLPSFSTIDRRKNAIEEKTHFSSKIIQDEHKQAKNDFGQQKQYITIKKQDSSNILQKRPTQMFQKQKGRVNQNSQKMKQFQKKLNYNLAQSTRVQDAKQLPSNIHNISSQESELVDSIDISSNSGKNVNQNEVFAKSLRMKKKNQEFQSKQQAKDQKQFSSKYVSHEKQNNQRNREQEQMQQNILSQKSDISENQCRNQNASERKILNKSLNSRLYQAKNMNENTSFDIENKIAKNSSKQQVSQRSIQNVNQNQLILQKHKSLPGLIYNPISHQRKQFDTKRSSNQHMQVEISKQKSPNFSNQTQTQKQLNLSEYHLSCLYGNSLIQQMHQGDTSPMQIQSARIKSSFSNNSNQSKESDRRPDFKSQESMRNVMCEEEFYQNLKVKQRQDCKYQNKITKNSQTYEYEEQYSIPMDKMFQNEKLMRGNLKKQDQMRNNTGQNERYAETLKKSIKSIPYNLNQQSQKRAQYSQKMKQQNKNDLSIYQINCMKIGLNSQVSPDDTNRMILSNERNISNHKHILSFHRKSSTSSNQQLSRQEAGQDASTNTAKQQLNKNMRKAQGEQIKVIPPRSHDMSVGHQKSPQNTNKITQTQTALSAQSNKKSQDLNLEYSHKMANTSIKKFHQINKKQYHDSQMNTAKTQKSTESVGQSTLKTIKLINQPLNVQKSRFNQTITDCSYLLNQIGSRTSKLGNDQLVSVVSHSQGPYGQYVRNPQQRIGEQENEQPKVNAVSQMMSEIEKLQFENQNLKSYNRVLLQKLSNSRPKKY